MNQQRYKKIYYRVWSGKLYKLVRIDGVKYDCEEKKIYYSKDLRCGNEPRY